MTPDVSTKHRSHFSGRFFSSFLFSRPTIMSDERSVEARLLSLLGLSLNSNLVDPNTDSSHYIEAEIPQHITSNLRNTADRSPSFELCHLARLGLSISSRTQADNFSYHSLALESCTTVHEAISGTFPMTRLHLLTRLLEDIEVFSSRNSYHHLDQVQEYRRRLGCILDDAQEEITASSTSLQIREVDSTARQIRFPPATIATTTYSGQSVDDACELDLWNGFTEILLKQWKTLGLFSTLIFGATLTMFQIPAVADNSLLRTVAHYALLSVMMSLIYISLLSIYFGSWRNSGTAVRWMQEMRTSNPYTFWNFWVLISLPAVWTCWGIFLFLASIDFIHLAAEKLTLVSRLFLMVVMAIGGLHLALTISKLRRVSRNPLGALDNVGFSV
ncbi:hypothetical protein B0H14DRAFT_2859496 [Mycena olivaceomarginata]|nr:hypothetical protein B0H14DRAFT_2859496 [Mycena olivaceomarginata]